jgi:hypothetical protein
MNKNQIIELLIQNKKFENDDEMYIFAEMIEELVELSNQKSLNIDDIHNLISVVWDANESDYGYLMDMFCDILEGVIYQSGDEGFRLFVLKTLIKNEGHEELSLILNKFLYENNRYQNIIKDLYKDLDSEDKKRMLSLFNSANLKNYSLFK